MSASTITTKKNTLWHVSKFRSTRALWMWRELELLYPDTMPELHVRKMDESTLRTNKPKDLLLVNRQGKVPTFQSDDDGCSVVLFESAAICNYFCRRFDIESKFLNYTNPAAMARHDMITHYVCGTADNVLATSSPIQRVLQDPKPGNQQEFLKTNEKAWYELVAPTLEEFVKTRRPSSSSLSSSSLSFDASDVIYGYTIAACARKFPERLQDFPILQSFYDNDILPRPAFQKAINE